jgi:hypothetical protein
MFRIVFWYVLPCKMIFDRRFRGAYCLHHEGWVPFSTQFAELYCDVEAARLWVAIRLEKLSKESKAVPLHAMVALGGRGGIAPICSWPRYEIGVSGQRHAPAALCPGESTLDPIVQVAGWASEPVWTQRLDDKSFAPAGDRTPIARSSSPYSDTILTELPRLLWRNDRTVK